MSPAPTGARADCRARASPPPHRPRAPAADGSPPDRDAPARSRRCRRARLEAGAPAIDPPGGDRRNRGCHGRLRCRLQAGHRSGLVALAECRVRASRGASTAPDRSDRAQRWLLRARRAPPRVGRTRPGSARYRGMGKPDRTRPGASPTTAPQARTRGVTRMHEQTRRRCRRSAGRRFVVRRRSYPSPGPGLEGAAQERSWRPTTRGARWPSMQR
jgi:hypothetical protein